jgi:glycosyltransferase involved in cell wall biosynthesis
MISVCIVAYNRDAMLARTAPALEASARACGDEVELVILRVGPEPFSAGAWRTLAANASRGEILVMLDADMLVPPDFLARMAAIVRSGKSAFPLYLREDHPGGHQSPGNGWGNSAFSREAWSSVAKAYNGHPYPEGTRWGHEDVAFAKRVHRIGPYWRELVPGFVHLWHHKSGSEWYGGKDRGMMGDQQ